MKKTVIFLCALVVAGLTYAEGLDQTGWLCFLKTNWEVDEPTADGVVRRFLQDGVSMYYKYNAAEYEEWSRGRAGLQAAQKAFLKASETYYKAVLTKAAEAGIGDAGESPESYARAESLLGWAEGKASVAAAEKAVKDIRALGEKFKGAKPLKMEGSENILAAAAAKASAEGFMVETLNGVTRIYSK